MPSAPSTAGALVPLPVCVLGRSGGTIFLEALSRHPEVVVCPRWPHEQRPAAYLVSARARLRLREEEPRADDPPKSFYENGRSPFSSREADLERDYATLAIARLDAAIRDGARDFYGRLAATLKKPAARCFGEKVDPNLLRDFAETFGTIRPIALVRDPRDALVSAADWFYKDTPIAKVFDARPRALQELLKGSFGQSWLKLPEMLERARRAGAEAFVVRYEELVREPERTFACVQEFAGLASAEGIALAAAAVREPPMKEKHLTSASAESSIGRWRRDLDAATQEELARALAPVVAALGYAP